MMDGLVIINYGAGNLRSVEKAFRAIGAEPRLTSDPSVVATAAAVVLPGVGAAGQIMRSLRALEMDDAVQEYVASGRPFLGVCMGMQVLLASSEEDGGQNCLGIVEGSVRRLRTEHKVPHMGWNSVRQSRPHPLWEGIPDESYFYFVHSYACHPLDPSVITGETEYDECFTSALAHDALFGTQFHPEKSGDLGLRLYRNFVEWALR